MESKSQSIFPDDASLTCDNVLAILSIVISKLQEGLGVPYTEGPNITQEQISALAQVLSHEITKFVLFASKSGEEIGIIRPTAEKVLDHVNTLQHMLRGLLVHAGPTLKAQVVSLGSSVMSRTSAVIEQMRPILKKKELVETSVTGQVWEVLKEIEKIPLTNATAVGKEVRARLSLLKDATDELSQLKVASEDDEADGGEGDDEFDDDFGYDGALTAEEHKIVPPSVALLNLAQGLVKKLYFFILKAKFDDKTPAEVKWLEDQLASAAALCDAADNLGAALYSPQDIKAVKTATHKLASEISAILGRLERHPQLTEVLAPAKAPAPAASADVAAAASSLAALSLAAPAPSGPACPTCGASLAPSEGATPATAETPTDAASWIRLVRKKVHEAHAHPALVERIASLDK